MHSDKDFEEENIDFHKLRSHIEMKILYEILFGSNSWI